MKSIVQSIDIFRNNTKFDGYTIRTNNGSINIKIGSDKLCCEEWYIFASKNDDKITNIIGAEIIDISYKKYQFNNFLDTDSKYGIKVNIKYKLNNMKKKLYIYMYNIHNGFYSHECIINWNIYINNKLNSFSIIENL